MIEINEIYKVRDFNCLFLIQIEPFIHLSTTTYHSISVKELVYQAVVIAVIEGDQWGTVERDDTFLVNLDMLEELAAVPATQLEVLLYYNK